MSSSLASRVASSAGDLDLDGGVLELAVVDCHQEVGLELGVGVDELVEGLVEVDLGVGHLAVGRDLRRPLRRIGLLTPALCDLLVRMAEDPAAPTVV